MGQSRLVYVGLISVVAMLSLLAAWGMSGSKSERQRLADAAPPARREITAVAEVRPVQKVIVTRASLTSQRPVELRAQASTAGSQQSVVEQLPAVGTAVDNGHVVAVIDGRPVFALEGAPAGRDLRPGDTGADVVAVQSALTKLGYPISPMEQEFGQSTQQAVEELFRSAGFDAATTTDPSGPSSAETGPSSVEDRRASARDAVGVAKTQLGAARAALTAARQAAPDTDADAAAVYLEAERVHRLAVDAARAAYAAALERSDPAAPAGQILTPVYVASLERTRDLAIAQADATLQAAQSQRHDVARRQIQAQSAQTAEVAARASAVAQAEATLREAERQLHRAETTDGVVLRRSEVLMVGALPATVLSSSQPSASSAVILTIDDGEPAIAVKLNAAQIRLLEGHGGLEVEIEVPSGRVVAGVPPGSPPATEGRADNEDAYTLWVPVAGVFEPSDLAVDSRTTLRIGDSSAVLAVPRTAVQSSADGSNIVSVVRDSRTSSVKVNVGRSADGWSAVEPSIPGELKAGDDVVVHE